MFKRPQQRKLALLIPAHNEGLVIQDTITSALRAGLKRRDIYLVSDGSTDDTVAIATEMLGAPNVISVEHSGKAGAVKKALDHFEIPSRYTWLHIADADSLFGPGYFKIFKAALDPEKYVAVTGYVQSLPGDWVSKFRVYEYVLAFTIIRRLQAWFGVITVIPGPTSCLRTDIINQLDFDAGSLTEDFDITLQIHRKNLGKIKYVPAAKTYTQDPKNLSDYVQQVSRWYRGFFQGVQDHKLGQPYTFLDAYVLFMIGQAFLYLAELLIWLPAVAIITRNVADVSVFFVSEMLVNFLIALMCAAVADRYDILVAFPLFYFLQLVNLFIFVRAFVEVILQKKFRERSAGWSTAGRRYALTQKSQTNPKGA